jgi:hypothetical protein
MAGENVVVNDVTIPSTDNLIGNTFLTAADITGKVIIQSHLNPSRDFKLTTQKAAMLPGVKEIINGDIVKMGKEATDLSDEEQTEKPKQGDTHGTEFRALQYCN